MRKWLIVLMAAVAIGATGILGWLYMRQDRKGPEITIAESKKNSYTSDMTTEDLLEGVKAVDKRDGDVSASLTVEIDRLSYVKDIQDDKDSTSDLYRKIQITGTVDVNTPGTYELTYYVVDSNGNASNGAVLTIVVK